MPQLNNVEIRSEEVQEILSDVPAWIIRWGITVFFSIIFAFLILSIFIKYPSTVSARVIITTQVPPTNVIARASGRLTLFINDQQLVEANDMLGVIVNTATTEDVFELIKLIEDFKSDDSSSNFDSIHGILLDQNLNLGELQKPFLDFQISLRNFKIFQDLKAYDHRLKSFNQMVEDYNRLHKQLEMQSSIYKEKFALSMERFKTDSLLYIQKAISELDFNRARSILLEDHRSLESVNSDVINNTIQISQLKERISDLSFDYSREEFTLRSNISDNLEQLEAEINNWKQRYLLQSPIGGKVSFSNYRSNNQFINVGDLAMTVIPNTQNIFGQVFMPVAGSGKVSSGQRVNLKFDNYPAREFGIVTGKIESISLIPREDVYTVRITLPNGLTTSYGKQLNFKQEMVGSAEIITEDLKLIQRIFNQFRTLVDN